MKTVLDCLIKNLKEASNYNHDVQVPPKCVLWTDKDKQWESIIPHIQSLIPELFVLGSYQKNEQKGPAIWLRCAIENKLPEVQVSSGRIPIIYIPGFSRQDMRAIEECPEEIKAIAELQYRGTFWTQLNHKDWTILSFLVNPESGLGLNVSHDQETKSSLLTALSKLIHEEVELLKDKALDKNYFNTLLTGQDWVKNVLTWINLGKDFETTIDTNEWKAFEKVCQSNLAFNPTKAGQLQAAYFLAEAKGAWQPVWERFTESPKRYENIYLLLKRANMPPIEIFSNVETHGHWPQWNESQEDILRQSLLEISDSPENELKREIAELERNHGPRRNIIWAELGMSPLACSLKYLNEIQNGRPNYQHIGTIDELAVAYSTSLYQTDDYVLRAVSCCNREEDINAISAVLKNLYYPWVDGLSRHLQTLVNKFGYPRKKIVLQDVQVSESECWMFIDGLRLDIAKRLISLIQNDFNSITEKLFWIGLPSVTATGKPLVSPVALMISGPEESTDFEPSIAGTSSSLRGGHQLKSLLRNNGFKVLSDRDFGDGKGLGWLEYGDIDSEGHTSEVKLCHKIDNLLLDIQDKIQLLARAGWKNIKIVTDHGWLLIPGSAQKTELTSSVTDSKWGRCASIKPDAIANCQQYPWFWNPAVSFALAPGASNFKNGQEYMHGGLSLQECLTLQIEIHTKQSTSNSNVKFTDIVWKGMRCNVVIEKQASGLKMDLRTEPDNPSSSIALNLKAFDEGGVSSVVVDDDSLDGKTAYIVVLDASTAVIAQASTIVGGGELND